MRKRKSTAFFGIQLFPACFLAAICVLLITTCYLEGDLDALWPTGSGTWGDPYIVHNVATLKKVGRGDDGWGLEEDTYYIQTRNIDLSTVSNWKPIGTILDPFNGNYNGLGHTIKNLNINISADNQGLFGVLGKKGNVEYVNLVNVNITGDDNTSTNTGSVAGLSYGTVTNCSSTGSVIGYDYVGGLVGQVCADNDDTSVVEKCYSTCNVTGTNYCAGGVAGYVTRGSNITYCYSTGKIEGSSNIGGVVGRVDVDSGDGIIEYCYSTGKVTGAYYIGGVVGVNNKGKVSNCYSTSNVTGDESVGGVTGLNQNGGNIIYCYSTGSVENRNDTSTGGVVGMNTAGDDTSSVEYCVALGPSVTNGGGTYIGRVAGYNLGTLHNNYARSNMTVTGLGTISPEDSVLNYGTENTHGANVNDDSHDNDVEGGYFNEDFWTGVMGWEFGNNGIWEIRSGGLPILQGFPGVTQTPEILN